MVRSSAPGSLSDACSAATRGPREGRPRAAAHAKENRMKNQNQNLLVAVAIWLACMAGLYVFYPDLMGKRTATEQKPPSPAQAPAHPGAPVASPPQGSGPAAAPKGPEVPRGTSTPLPPCAS